MALGPGFRDALAGGLEALGLALPDGSAAKLEAYAELLLRWNAKVNLTAVTDPEAVAELHLVDSLALTRTLGTPSSLLDVGTGAGLPALPLAVARPGLRVWACDAVSKKVAFVKAAAAALAVDVSARALRAGGEPVKEGLPRCEAVVSRAVADPARWLPLGAPYLADGGALYAMLGREPGEAALAALAEPLGLRLDALDRFTLPRSGAARAVARFVRA